MEYFNDANNIFASPSLFVYVCKYEDHVCILCEYVRMYVCMDVHYTSITMATDSRNHDLLKQLQTASEQGTVIVSYLSKGYYSHINLHRFMNISQNILCFYKC